MAVNDRIEAEIRNHAWNLLELRNQYSYRNPHSDLYLYLNQWVDLRTYLNVGYFEPGQYALTSKAHHRLISRVADGLLAMHRSSIHSRERLMLDVASGRGGPAIFMHSRHGLDVLGVDITPFNVTMAERNKVGRQASAAVRFVIGDALELPLADCSFSMAWSIESPAHFPDKSAFLKEIGRVLKPGGSFAFADLEMVVPVATASSENRRIYEDFLRVWDVPYLESHESYLENISNAGLELVRADIITSNNLEVLERLCRWFLILLGIPPVYWMYKPYIKVRTGANLDNVYDHVRKSYRALRLGMIDYGIFWARKRNE